MSKIDVEFIKPFIDGALETMSVQCSRTFKVETPKVYSKGSKIDSEIIASIGVMSKVFRGSISICFPEKTFLSVMEGMLEEKFTHIDESLEDGAAEILNIIFGYGKQRLNEKGYSIEKAIPTIIRGSSMQIGYSTKCDSIVLPFSSDEHGKFYCIIAVE